MPKMPLWKVPKNIQSKIARNEGYWEDDRWAPIQLTAMTDTEFEGREIPIAWQIEFDPSDDEFEAVNEQLEELEIEPDGYGWGNHIQKTIQQRNPTLAKRLHLTDCETDTCVIWVESAEDCRIIMETVWNMIHSDED